MEDKQHTAMTLTQAKDKTAQNHEFTSWDSMCKMLKRNGVYEANIGVFHDEATGILTASLTSELKELKEKYQHGSNDSELYKELEKVGKERYEFQAELKELKEWKLEAEGKLIEVAQAAGILSNENDSLKAELKAKEEEIERQIGEYLVLGAKLVKANEELTRLKSDPELLRGSIGVELVRQNLELKEALIECRSVLHFHLSNSMPIHSSHQSDFFNQTANAITIAESALSKHQPIKKDPSIPEN